MYPIIQDISLNFRDVLTREAWVPVRPGQNVSVPPDVFTLHGLVCRREPQDLREPESWQPRNNRYSGNSQFHNLQMSLLWFTHTSERFLFACDYLQIP